jgi:hypothetical protein
MRTQVQPQFRNKGYWEILISSLLAVLIVGLWYVLYDAVQVLHELSKIQP